MKFYPTERIGVFIDGSNLFATARALHFDIDYKRLLNLFSEQGQLVRAFYYTAMVDDQDYSPIRPLVDWLDYNGFMMVTKPTKEFTDASGRRKIKGNMDIELAVDVMEMMAHLDHVVLFSGDGDFRRLVDAVQRKGLRVSVVSTIQCSPPMIADELRRQADNFIDLADLQPSIERMGEDRHRVAAAYEEDEEDEDWAEFGLTSRPAVPHVMTAMTAAEPPLDCSVCQRLVAFRRDNRAAEPAWHNGPVRSFGDEGGRLAIVGLAPGLKGANRTGRPFTGDFAGDLLYGTLLKFGFARGRYGAEPDDGLTLVDCLITNAVRCVPPENKPTGPEIKACRPFLGGRLAAMAKLTAILALGRIAHDSTLAALGARGPAYPFAHGAAHALSGVTLYDSYHCSRYNTNTGRLTTPMFHDVLAKIRRQLS